MKIYSLEIFNSVEWAFECLDVVAETLEDAIEDVTTASIPGVVLHSSHPPELLKEQDLSVGTIIRRRR